jgi:excisionase family DNA binding protein
MTALLESIDRKLDALLAGTVEGTRYYSVGQAATYTGLSRDSIRKLIDKGAIQALRPVPARIVIDKLELDKYMAGCK